MSSDTNEVRLSGSVERIRQVQTRTGAPMVEIILAVRRDKFRITALGNVAEHLLVACGPDDRLSVTGTLTTSSWKDESSGEWHSSFSVQAWGLELSGDKVSYQRKQVEQSAPAPRRRRDEMYTAQAGDPF